MDDQQRGHLEALRRIHQDRLRKLEQQAAAFGLYAPPHVLTEIDAERAEIARIDGELAQAVAAGPPIAEASAARPQALPIAPTPLIGREQAVAKLAESAAAGRRAPGHADRPRRHRQDAPGAAGRRECGE